MPDVAQLRQLDFKEKPTGLWRRFLRLPIYLDRYMTN
jgi:hypothetical protein